MVVVSDVVVIVVEGVVVGIVVGIVVVGIVVVGIVVGIVVVGSVVVMVVDIVVVATVVVDGVVPLQLGHSARTGSMHSSVTGLNSRPAGHESVFPKPHTHCMNFVQSWGYGIILAP